MIKTYSELDLKSPGCYGFRPLLDFSQTCYSKSIHMLQSNSDSSFVDAEFLDMIDSVSRCIVPTDVKNKICKALQAHCFDCGVNVNLDLNAISNLPPSLQVPFIKLMQHASSIDSRSKKLVLDVLKIVTEYADAVDNSPTPPINSDNLSADVAYNNDDPVNDDNLHISSPCNPRSCLKKTSQDAPQSSDKTPQKPCDPLPSNHMIHSSTRFDSTKLSDDHIRTVLQKLTKATPAQSPTTVASKSQGFAFPPSGYPKGGPEALMRMYKSRPSSSLKVMSQSKICDIRDPLCDISNVDIVQTQSKSIAARKSSDVVENSDIIPLDNDDGFVPDSLSPRTRSGRKILVSDKQSSESELGSPLLTQRSQVTPPSVTTNLSAKSKSVSANNHVRFQSSTDCAKKSDSSDIQVLGTKSLSQSICEMTRKSDEIYNKKFCSNDTVKRTPLYGSASSSAKSSPMQTYVSRASSTGGKLPLYGPRRVIKPGPLFQVRMQYALERFIALFGPLENL